MENMELYLRWPWLGVGHGRRPSRVGEWEGKEEGGVRDIQLGWGVSEVKQTCDYRCLQLATLYLAYQANSHLSFSFLFVPHVDFLSSLCSPSFALFLVSSEGERIETLLCSLWLEGKRFTSDHCLGAREDEEIRRVCGFLPFFRCRIFVLSFIFSSTFPLLKHFMVTESMVACIGCLGTGTTSWTSPTVIAVLSSSHAYSSCARSIRYVASYSFILPHFYGFWGFTENSRFGMNCSCLISVIYSPVGEVLFSCLTIKRVRLLRWWWVSFYISKKCHPRISLAGMNNERI